MNAGNDRTRGLESIRAARVARKAGRTARLTPQVAGVGLFLLLATIGIYRYVWSNQLETSRKVLAGKQRATAATVGKEWSDIAQRLEDWTVASAQAYPGDLRDPGLRNWPFQQQPGLWLRARLADATRREDLQRVVQFSVRDAFVGCFLGEAATPVRQAMTHDDDAPADFPEQPWNMKRAYQATRVLAPTWLAELQLVNDDLRMRYLEKEFEKAEHNDIPIAIDIIKKARYFLLLLDEDVAGAKAEGDAGLMVSDLSVLPHPVRVTLVDLQARKVMLRLRLASQGEYHMLATDGAMLSASGQVSDETTRAIRRQVNNCDLASEAKLRMNAE
jgi:hypothetical protein